MCPASFDRRSKSKARERADLGASRLDLPGVEQVGDSMWLSLLGESPGSSGPGGGVSDSRDHLFCDPGQAPSLLQASVSNSA